MITYFRKTDFTHDFSPSEHEWLASVSPSEFIFVNKPTDRWTSPGNLKGFVQVAASEVPVEVRRKAGQRLGAYRSASSIGGRVRG